MPAPSPLTRFKARRVPQWALAYLAAAWVLVESTSLVSEQFGWHPLVAQSVTVLAFFGFLVTIVLAWFHGEKGQQRVSAVEGVVLTSVLILTGATLWRVGRAPLVHEAAAPSEATDLGFAGSLTDLRPTIAVLPLANLGTSEENQYLAAGLHEEVLRSLSVVSELAVISRTSVMRYGTADRSIPQIASELGAGFIVEGSVQESDGRVRVQVQLIEGASDRHLWADHYDRTMGDLFEVQSEIAQAIADAVQVAVTPDEQARIEAPATQNPLAYELYLRALDLNYYERDEYETALTLLRRATELDPDFVSAHTWAASFHQLGGMMHGVPGALDSALAHVEMALAIDPTDPEALGGKAFMLAQLSQVEAAGELAERALMLNPSSWRAWNALAARGWWWGRPVEGALTARRALMLAPAAWQPHYNLAMSLLFAGMYEEAELWQRRLLEIDPGNLWAMLQLGTLGMLTGDLDQMRLHWTTDPTLDNPVARYWASIGATVDGDFEQAAEWLRPLVASAPVTAAWASISAEVIYAWLTARLGDPAADSLIASIRRRRLEDPPSVPHLVPEFDLLLLSSATGDREGHLRDFLGAAEADTQKVLPLHRNFPWIADIIDEPEVQAWLEASGREQAEWQAELRMVGDWVPETFWASNGGRSSP